MGDFNIFWALHEFFTGIIRGMFTAVLSFIAAYILLVALIAMIDMVKRWNRRRKIDARIIRQAKAANVWDKQPMVLGGRALELKAWQDFKIKRKPGETDAHLRRRCMDAAENELANTPRC